MIHPVNQNQKISAEQHQSPPNPSASVLGQAWCCAPPSNPCCPKISLMSDGTYKISDDYGSSINLDKESMSEVIKQVSSNLQ